jgi:hypothetical protein
MCLAHVTIPTVFSFDYPRHTSVPSLSDYITKQPHLMQQLRIYESDFA